jgi:hypothetical protein
MSRSSTCSGQSIVCFQNGARGKTWEEKPSWSGRCFDPSTHDTARIYTRLGRVAAKSEVAQSCPSDFTWLFPEDTGSKSHVHDGGLVFIYREATKSTVVRPGLLQEEATPVNLASLGRNMSTCLLKKPLPPAQLPPKPVILFRNIHAKRGEGARGGA